MISVAQPIWLLLAIPLVAAMIWWRMPGRMLTTMRGGLYALVLLAMAGLAIQLPSRSGTVVVLVDRSRSMPADSDARAVESVRLIDEARRSGDELVVIGFGRTSVIERASGADPFRNFTASVGDDASNYAEALERSMAMIPAGSRGTILVLGDGRWTGHDPVAIAARASARGIVIDHRSYERPRTGDVAIARLDAPRRVNPSEGYLLTAWVQSPTSKEVRYELLRGNIIIARGTRSLSAGMNHLVFRDRADEPGVANYQLLIEPLDPQANATSDPIPENNRARLLVGVEGPRPILHVAPSNDSALGSLLRAGQLDVHTTTGQDVDWSLEQLAGYSAVILENVPSQVIGSTGMQTLADWVRQTGSGLMMSGGQKSFGPGGYYKSPLEEVLPVSMELRREHRKLAVAIVVTLDRSGSMMAPVAGGKSKMDLANLASVEVVNMLTGMDQFGAWAVDSSPHKIAELQNVTDKAKLTNSLLSIQSMGGGIFVYEALKAAVGMISQSELGTRHIVLFSDASDSEEPGNYVELLEKATAAGITCSVIGLGKPTDMDAGLLEDIARRGGGRCYFTDQPEELPRLFAQDAFIVARSTFIDEPVNVQSTGGFAALVGTSWEIDQPVGGYNLTYLRDGATSAAVTVDEYRAPLIASWHAGAGRSLVYTSEADGQYTGPIAQWPHVGEMFTSLVRWTAGRDQSFPGGAVLTQEVVGDLVRVTLHLDPQRTADPFTTLPVARILQGTAGQPPNVSEMTMQWSGPDELIVETSLTGDQTAIISVQAGEQTVSLEPVTLMYSPEFEPVDESRGAATLAMLSSATGGKSRTVLGEIWNDLPKNPRSISLTPWLSLAALLVLLAEVFERRSGALSSWKKVGMRRDRAEAADAAAARRSEKSRKRRPQSTTSPVPSPDQPEPSSPEPSPPQQPTQPSLDDALTAARRRARDRL